MPRRFSAISLVALLLSGVAFALTGPTGLAAAKDVKPLAPPQIDGMAVYIPYNVAIKIDGKLNDWAGVPVQVVDYGPKTSSNFLEDGQFSFSVAADQANFYITMSAVDKTIIAGKHAGAFWNEDSMEFFLNTTGNLNTKSYKGVYQININAADIGKKDPNGLILTGVNSEKIHVRGLVFKTQGDPKGWGFEAAVPLADLGVVPAPGLEIGFQAQLNGASVLDRDVQLAWSKADVTNISYQDPSVFGTAIFFKVGASAVPTPGRLAPTPTPPPPPAPPQVSVNQVGYYPSGPKIASYALADTSPQTWKLLNGAGQQVATGQTTIFGVDPASGSRVHLIDFSAYTTPGTGYTLHVGAVASDPFKISADLYSSLEKDALAYYYRSRSGIDLTAQYAGAQWARVAGHLSDSSVTCYKGVDTNGKVWPGCDYSLNVSGGWYDAGDYGKYVVNGGISVWTLMNEYERNPKAFADGTLNIPENKNGVSDILDEARWELTFMLGMQVPAGKPQAGMVHHKVHDDVWSSLPSMPPTQATNRYLFPPSTAATLNLAAVGAQCARIWKTIDPAFSAKCLTAAETAWAAAKANPSVYAVPFAAGGGDYSDTKVDDEFYWAASELFVTTGNDTYKDYLLASPDWASGMVPSWGSTAGLGTISLAVIPNKLPADKVQAARQAILDMADRRLGFAGRQGYGVPVANFVWGSNSEVLNSAMLMGLSYQFSGDRKYLDGAAQALDYVLGRNPLNKSYITGYGTNPVQHPHHRFWAGRVDEGYPTPPPGVVAGGPNDMPSDPATLAAGLTGNPEGKSYVDDIASFSTNEVAINWNAPLAWVTAFVDQEQHKSSVAPPAAPAPKDDGSPDQRALILVPVLLVVGVMVFWVWRRGRRNDAGA